MALSSALNKVLIALALLVSMSEGTQSQARYLTSFNTFKYEVPFIDIVGEIDANL